MIDSLISTMFQNKFSNFFMSFENGLLKIEPLTSLAINITSFCLILSNLF